MESYEDNGTIDTLNEDSIDHTSYQIILPAVAVFIVIIAIIFGNSLVCIAIWKVRSLNGIQNWFLFSLAISDLMVGVLIMPFGIVNKLLGTWVFGTLWCQAWKCLDVNACSASILNLCLISVDRYFSIIQAVKYIRWRSAFRAKVMIASVWILSALISLPPLFGWQGQSAGGKECRLSDNNAYIIYSTLCSFFIPAFIIVYIYIRIWFAAKKHARTSIRSVSKTKKTKKGTYEMANNATEHTCVDQLEPTSGGSDEVEPPSSPQESSHTDNEKDEKQPPNSSPKWKWHKKEDETPGETPTSDQKEKIIGDDKTALVKEVVVVTKAKNGLATENGKSISKETEIDRQKRKLAHARERRATLVLGIIMGGFILSWYPFFQLYFITAICEKCVFPDLLFSFFEWIGYCNSAINPLIYTFFNRDFRKAFKKLLGCGR